MVVVVVAVVDAVVVATELSVSRCLPLKRRQIEEQQKSDKRLDKPFESGLGELCAVFLLLVPIWLRRILAALVMFFLEVDRVVVEDRQAGRRAPNGSSSKTHANANNVKKKKLDHTYHSVFSLSKVCAYYWQHKRR